MRGQKHDMLQGYTIHHIHIGGICVSCEPIAIRTVLGSCIAVCLLDTYTHIGGMNHFMLPEASEGTVGGSRYGGEAMEMLVERCVDAGACRTTLVAKVFGGANVLNMAHSEDNVSQSNMRFVFEYLNAHNIRVVARDVGGTAARELYLFTESGKVILRRIFRSETERNADWIAMVQAERDELRRTGASRIAMRNQRPHRGNK